MKPICCYCCCSVAGEQNIPISLSHSFSISISHYLLHFISPSSTLESAKHVVIRVRASRRRNEIGLLRVFSKGTRVINVWQTRAEMKFRSSKTFPNRLPTSTITTLTVIRYYTHGGLLGRPLLPSTTRAHSPANNRYAVLRSKCVPPFPPPTTNQPICMHVVQ